MTARTARELAAPADLRAAADDDPLLLWAARGLTRGARAWHLGDAAAVASPALSGRDRIAVRGPLDDALPLLRQVLDATGPAFRPLGERALVTALARRLPDLAHAGDFGLMTTTGPALPPAPPGLPAAHWLAPAELPEAAALLDRHFATSYAHPQRPGADAWAGVRDPHGRLTAIAADAWSSPEVGLLAGVATDPARGRGNGHAEAACRLVLDRHLTRRGRAALLVDDANTAAIRLYTRLGLRLHPLAAAHRTAPDGRV
ncbi:GNAT family N-acetyltransferase [Kitasatospora sp. NPDC059571]|uniref:GNAT family N-acetyltransferase n=1 Tax=Kitasatospora sp. NPDC059571 TaxID=3346871 RepID=UPI0036956DB0